MRKQQGIVDCLLESMCHKNAISCSFLNSHLYSFVLKELDAAKY
jgi:hypothetical protein